MDIREDDLSHPQTIALLRLHLAGMHANSPPGHVFALDLSGLKTPDITVWTLWRDDRALGIGALRQLDAQGGEIKSMRTPAAAETRQPLPRRAAPPPPPAPTRPLAPALPSAKALVL